ncbi:ADP-ribose pyrophosphatase [Kineococcus xinjiangensis]|uniref:ADP-ribose pyrophosphatase n=1 Tax=Kineococcus xinjiangensis TaxID=512762 RepID=A0A2S6ICA5_9ACTN|nr:NUDIX hydrolase [Kineococcus xinjiangensis]PPK90858.1 ADP-ribose pyrophosphatase [Kineococcus xinjiangensis]
MSDGLPGTPATGADLADRRVEREVRSSEVVFAGRVWDVVREDVALPGEDGGQVVTREFQRHPGAVTVLALDDDERVLFLRQYRHPVRHELWELPAGLLDVDGEDPLAAAQRELAEEADLRAGSWAVLADWFNSPGGSDEALRAYVARGLSAVPAEQRHVREDEEADMPLLRVPLDEARDAVLAGRVHNPGAVISVLAACAAREQGWATLRPADAPWPEHPRLG